MTHSDKTNTEATLDLNLGVPQNQADEILFPALNAIRDNDPVFWSEANNSWILTRYDHILEAFRDRRFSSAGSFLFGMEHHIELNEVPNLVKYSQSWLMNMDGIDHIRVRKALVPIFSKASIDRYIPLIEEIAVELVDEIASKGSVEYVMEVAFQLPAFVITTILGLDKKHLDDIKRWSDIMVITVLPQHLARKNLMAGEQALVEMNALILSEIDARRVQPRDDLLTDFMKLIDNGSLTLDEALATLQIILVAGHDTTANSNVLALQALVSNPEQLAYFRDNIDRAIDMLPELIRYTSMAATQFRIASEDIELGGKTIKKGDFILLSQAAAHRDSDKFDSPEELDLSRDASGHLSFAPGLHFCLGHYLARLELSIFFKHLVVRFDNIAIPKQKTVHNGNFVFRGIESLQASFS